MLDLGKTLIYAHSEYKSKVKLCYTGTDSFVYKTKKEDFSGVILKAAETKFDTSGCSKVDNGPSPIARQKEVIGMVKVESS